MQRYRIVVLIVLFGILPVAIAFFVALSYLKDEAASPGTAVALPDAIGEEAAPPAEPPETRKVLAAARALPFGSLIGDEDLTTLEIDLAAVRKGHILPGEEEPVDVLRGYAVRVPIASGEMVMRSAVVGPGQRGFLAAVLGPGARAVTIRVGPATSHAGLVDPGDRVDVILSAELETSGGHRSVLARTIVEDVRVVAVDRRVGNRGGAPGGDASGPPDGEAAQRTEMITATLEVSPEQGDRLVLGEHEGKLSLAVRSLAAAVPRPAITAVDLQDLLLSPHEVESAVVAESLRREIASLEERLRAEEEERKRLEEEERLEKIAIEHGLERIRTVGSAFLATAGLLHPVADPVLEAARCGLGMAAATAESVPRWEVRIGMHVGPVLAGVMGGRRFPYDLWGAAAEYAAQLAEHAAPGGVTVTAATWARIESRCRGRNRGPMELKGKGEVELVECLEAP